MRLRNMALPAFVNYIKDKDLVCLGAGKLFNKVCRLVMLEPYVKIVIDNDPNKHGKVMEYEGQSFSIHSWDKLNEISFLSKKTIVLISASVVGPGMELYEALIKRDIPSDIECFFLSYIFAEPDSNEKIGHLMNFRLSKRPLIPKYIHYCWFGETSIPEEQQRFIRGWQEQCPDFEIIKWDESNYDVKKNKYMKKAYEEGRWGFVPDYARKDIIYSYGGIYLDTDVEIVRNMEELLYQDGFAGVQFDNRVNFGLGFGGKPGLDIMAEMCELYNTINFEFSEGMRMKVGPDYETKIMKSHGYEDEKGIQTVAGLTIYPPEVLSGTLPYNNISFITENTFTVHHYVGSWVIGERKKRNQESSDFYKNVSGYDMEE